MVDQPSLPDYKANLNNITLNEKILEMKLSKKVIQKYCIDFAIKFIQFFKI